MLLSGSEDQNADSNVDSKVQAQKISVSNKRSIGSWTGDCVTTQYSVAEKFIYIFTIS